MTLRLTTAGIAALASAEYTGLNAIRITHIAIGDGSGPGGAADDGRTALRSERDRSAATGTPATNGRISFRGDFMPAAAYNITEAGVFATAGGNTILLAYWTKGGAKLGAAVASADLVIAATIAFAEAAAQVAVTVSPTLTVGRPPAEATTGAFGITRYTTDAEAKAGLAGNRAVTAKAMRAPPAQGQDGTPANASWWSRRSGGGDHALHHCTRRGEGRSAGESRRDGESDAGGSVRDGRQPAGSGPGRRHEVCLAGGSQRSTDAGQAGHRGIRRGRHIDRDYPGNRSLPRRRLWFKCWQRAGHIHWRRNVVDDSCRRDAYHRICHAPDNVCKSQAQSPGSFTGSGTALSPSSSRLISGQPGRWGQRIVLRSSRGRRHNHGETCPCWCWICSLQRLNWTDHKPSL